MPSLVSFSGGQSTGSMVEDDDRSVASGVSHLGFYQNINGKPFDKSEWMGSSQMTTFPELDEKYNSGSSVISNQIGRKRVPQHKRDGRGMVEQISTGMVSLDAACRTTIPKGTRPVNLESVYDSFEESKKNDARLGSLPGHTVGAGNRSNIMFGDDRIRFKTSYSQEVYKLDPQRAERTVLGTANRQRWIERSRKQRILDYKQATDHIGYEALGNIESILRQRLTERISSGPYQLRRMLQKYNHDGSGEIDYEDFTQLLLSFGLNFNRFEVTSLFGRHDSRANGLLNFQELINNLLGDQLMSENSRPKGSLEELRTGKTNVELENVKQKVLAAYGKIVIRVNADPHGKISRQQFELLCVALGKDLDSIEIESAFSSIDLNTTGEIDIDEFVVWMMSNV